MSFSRPIHWYHSPADPIWPGGTVKLGNFIIGGKFGIVGENFVLVLESFFMKISNLCKNQFVNGIILKICVK
jgi:hypothetical protein